MSESEFFAILSPSLLALGLIALVVAILLLALVEKDKKKQ